MRTIVALIIGGVFSIGAMALGGVVTYNSALDDLKASLLSTRPTLSVSHQSLFNHYALVFPNTTLPWDELRWFEKALKTPDPESLRLVMRSVPVTSPHKKQWEDWERSLSDQIEKGLNKVKTSKRKNLLIEPQRLLQEFLGVGEISGTDSVYQSGVLQGLPVLAVIPDHLEKLTDLALALEEANASMNAPIRGYQPDGVLKELQQIREATQNALQKGTTSSNELSETIGAGEKSEIISYAIDLINKNRLNFF